MFRTVASLLALAGFSGVSTQIGIYECDNAAYPDYAAYMSAFDNLSRLLITS
jgi:hypothetical protein